MTQPNAFALSDAMAEGWIVDETADVVQGGILRVDTVTQTPKRLRISARRTRKIAVAPGTLAHSSEVNLAEDGRVRPRLLMDMLKAATQYGSCITCRRALRPGVASSGTAMLTRSKRKADNSHTRVALTTEQARELDLIVVMVIRRCVRW